MKRQAGLVPVAVAGLLAGSVLAQQAAPAALVSKVRVQPDLAPDCTSLKAMAESVTRGAKNNDEKAVAIYNFMNLTHYHRQYPSEPGGVPVLKEINCYGWSLCGGLHSEQSALWRELGWKWRFVGWNGHTTVEAGYDDTWHYLDVFLKFYAWKPNGKGGWTIAGEDELAQKSKELIGDVFYMDNQRGTVCSKNDPFQRDGKANWKAPDFLSCGDTIDGTISGLKTHKGAGAAESWMGINHANGSYNTDVNLTPGLCLANTWEALPDAWYWAGQQKAPGHTCPGHKDTRNNPAYGLVLEPYVNLKPCRSYGNGTLTFAPNLADPAVLDAFVAKENVKVADKALTPDAAGKPASVTVLLSSPYILTKAAGEIPGADSIEVSTDGGKSFKAADLKDFSAAVKGSLSAQVRVTFKEPVKALKLEAVFQNNPGALPYLSPGKNKVTVSVDDPKALGKNKLVVTYAYKLGSRAKSLEQLAQAGKRLANGTGADAKWSDTVTYVRKTFTAKDLPATFDIDCPTPKGQYPVYPRMVFLRREVVSPAGTPSALPDGAVEAAKASADELVSLPNPFLIGTELPPSK
jgi:hypothetical protein